MYKNMAQRQHFIELTKLLKDGSADNLPEHLLVLVGETLYNHLRRIERKAHRLAERECDDPMLSMEHAERLEKRYIKEVFDLFGGLPDGFFLNSDPRGYALKIDGESVISHTDWGGYHILAPDF